MEHHPIPAATLLSSERYLTPGTVIVDRFFRVPLSYAPGSSESLVVFIRNAIPNRKQDEGESGSKLPYLLFLQGGPGVECPPPGSLPITNYLFDKGFQVLFIDQRGTGLSSAISAGSLAKKGSVAAQAAYLKLFRADNIVRDCEAIRKTLLGGGKWSILGYSFGGFCAVTYLSLCPGGLKEVFATGGMGPIVNYPDEVYTRLYERVISRNEAYYEKYPSDVPRVRRILAHLTDVPTTLPNGGTLTPRRFQELGLWLGITGGIDSLHLHVQRASTDIDIHGEISYKELQNIQASQPLDGNIIYALLHEATYCQGSSSRWSAHRMLTDPRFSWPKMSVQPPSSPVFFTGEMIYPHMFEDYAQLRLVSDLAHALAEDSSWPNLYDREALAKNTVPVWAATYIDDMYVDLGFARETAKAIKGAKEVVTNTLLHDAVRSRTEQVMEALWRVRGRDED